MSFVSRFFGSSDPLAPIRKASRQGEWADVLARISTLKQESLSEHVRNEVQILQSDAAEHLARINYEEGVVCLQTDDLHRGLEHFELAKRLTRDEQLVKEIEKCLADLGSSAVDVDPAINAQACSSSCCNSSVVSPEMIELDDLDEEAQFELVLTAYPPQEHERYRMLSPALRKAVMFSHADQSVEAMRIFSDIPETERSDIYDYECGSLYGRVGRYQEAVALLNSALQKNSRHMLAATALVELYLTNRQVDAAEKLIQAMLAAGWLPDYCQARLSHVFQMRGDVTQAVNHAQEALRLGYRDQQLMVFVAGVLEADGKLGDAEELLQAIPVSGGCCGGANVDLADFWLRHNRKLQQALEMYKKAAKSDPANFVWGFKIAEVYIALGWKKDARPLLESLASSDLVSVSLRNDASQLLEKCS